MALFPLLAKRRKTLHLETINNVTTMKKDYLEVNAILNVEGLEFDKDGKCNLTEDQVKAVNDKVNTLEQDITDKQTLIDQKRAN